MQAPLPGTAPAGNSALGLPGRGRPCGDGAKKSTRRADHGVDALFSTGTGRAAERRKVRLSKKRWTTDYLKAPNRTRSSSLSCGPITTSAPTTRAPSKRSLR